MLPIVLDLALYDRPPSPVIVRRYRDGRTNLLFVGRVIPNKKIDDLIRVFAVYQRYVDPVSRLLLVGDYRGHERYLRAAAGDGGRASRLDEVVFTGQVDDDDLYAYYTVADAVPLPLRARGLLRAAPGGHGLRGAGDRLRRGGGARRRCRAAGSC